MITQILRKHHWNLNKRLNFREVCDFPWWGGWGAGCLTEMTEAMWVTLQSVPLAWGDTTHIGEPHGLHGAGATEARVHLEGRNNFSTYWVLRNYWGEQRMYLWNNKAAEFWEQQRAQIISEALSLKCWCHTGIAGGRGNGNKYSSWQSHTWNKT